jgi:amidase
MAVISSDRCVYALSRDDAPAARISAGEEVVLETRDCFGDQVTRPGEELGEIDWAHINPATGPVYVEGARPGDVLSVKIERLETASQGIVATGPGFGVLGEQVGELRWWLVPIGDGMVELPAGGRIPAKLMIGVMGVAPAGEPVPCGTPGPHGGNMDTSLIGEGATLHLPVFVEGALLAAGDLHAVMGEGEIGVTGAEVAGRVTLRPRVRRDLALTNPVIETPEAIATIASAGTFDAAGEAATADMAKLLTGGAGLSLTDAIMLMSVAGHLRVSQVVDPLKTARFELPRSVAEALAAPLV